MSDLVPFTRPEIQQLALSTLLRNALLLAAEVQSGKPFTVSVSETEEIAMEIGEIPATIEIDGQDYVVDEDEVSVVYHEDELTTCAIHVRPDRTQWTKWANADGHDSIVEELVYSRDKSRDLQALSEFNDRITD